MEFSSYTSLIISTILGYCIDLTFAQGIPTFNLTNSECTTQCSKGLLKSKDVCRFHMEVGLSEDLTPSSTLLFETKEDTQDVFLPLFNLQLLSDCTGYKEIGDYYCTQTDTRTFVIVIKPKDMSRFNNAQIRAYLTSSNANKMYSEVQRLPKLHDQTDVTGILKINGQSTSSGSNCNQIIDVTDVTLEFQCFGPATPCLVELAVNEIVVNQSKDHVSFSQSTTIGEELSVSMKFAACSLAGKYNAMNCKIKTGEKFKQEITTFKLLKHKCASKCIEEFPKDSCVFYFSISFYAAVTNNTFLFFELLGPLDARYKPLFNLDLHSQCAVHKRDSDFNCTRLSSSDFGIDIAARELERFRDAKVRVYLKLDKQEKTINSEPLSFPQLNDQSHELGILKVNGQVLSHTINNCNITTKDDNLILEFNCQSSVKPCLIDLQVDNNIVLEKQENNAVYRGHYTSGRQLPVNITYRACGFRHLFCTIVIAATPSNILNTEMQPWLIPVVATVASIVTILIVTAIVLCCFLHKGFRLCQDDAATSNLQDNETMAASIVMLGDITHDNTDA